MPQFSNQAPADTTSNGIRLLRTPAAVPLTGHVLSDVLMGCPTHYVGNRTIPCEGEECTPCESGVTWRWHAWIAIQLSTTQEVVLFEMTAKASETFTEYYKRYGTIRGAAFKAYRLNQKSNGRVLIQAKPADLAKVTLAPEPNVQKLLCHIWNIPETQVIQTDHQTRPPARNLAVDRARAELRVAAEDPTDPPTPHEILTAFDAKYKGNGRTQPADA